MEPTSLSGAGENETPDPLMYEEVVETIQCVDVYGEEPGILSILFLLLGKDALVLVLELLLHGPFKLPQEFTKSAKDPLWHTICS